MERTPRLSPAGSSVRALRRPHPDLSRIEAREVAHCAEPPLSYTGRLPLGTTRSGAFVYDRSDALIPVGYVRPGRGYRSALRTLYTARADKDGKVVSVTESLSWRVVGTSPNGKPYTRWFPSAITVLRRLPTGRQAIFRRVWSRSGQRRFAFAFYAGDETISDALRDLAGELLGPAPHFLEMHPLLGEHDRLTIQHQTFTRNFWRVDNIPDLTRNLFGASRYRKDLVKSVARARPLGLFAAWSMRGLVPTDWVITLLQRHTAAAEDHRLDGWFRQVPQSDLRPHLRGLDEVTLRRLTRNVTGLTSQQIGDLTWMQVAPPVRLRTWEELHDHTARIDNLARRARQRMRSAGSEVHDRARIDSERSALTGITERGLRVFTATEPETLLDWGRAARNCISSYEQGLLYGTVHLLGIYDGGALVANAEIEPGPPPNLRQLLGRFNKHLPREQHDDIVAFLTGRGVDCSESYEGRIGRAAA